MTVQTLKVLIIGSGGREHALACSIVQSPRCQQLWVAPGNAGTAMHKQMHNVPIRAEQMSEVLAFARAQAIDLVVIGPEAPLAAGLADLLRQHHIACVGPNQAAAQLESSKTFSKQFMLQHDIPSAKFASFTAITTAMEHIKQQHYPLVIKADGLAAGKGVVIAQNHLQAVQTIKQMLQKSGDKIVIEEFIKGSELSYIVLANGQAFIPLASSQDHKAAFDGNQGPNTGGMGAYSPAAQMTLQLEQKIQQQVIIPTLRGMQQQGYSYQGFLYAGIMLTEEQEIKVLEFNCRLGDPETQVILPRLKSDLLELLWNSTQHSLDFSKVTLAWDRRPAVGVVLAANAYPAAYAIDIPLPKIKHYLEQAQPEGQYLFIAGAKQHPSLSLQSAITPPLSKPAKTSTSTAPLLTSGGRVACCVALGDTLRDAQQRSYQLSAQLSTPGLRYRRDIAQQGCLNRQGAAETAADEV